MTILQHFELGTRVKVPIQTIMFINIKKYSKNEEMDKIVIDLKRSQ